MQNRTADPLSGTVFWCEPGDSVKAMAANSTWFDNVVIHPSPLGNKPGAHWF